MKKLLLLMTACMLVLCVGCKKDQADKAKDNVSIDMSFDSSLPKNGGHTGGEASTTQEEPVETTPEEPVETTQEEPVETTPEEPVETTQEEPVEDDSVDTTSHATEDDSSQDEGLQALELTSDEVLWLQESLKQMGYYTALTGIYDQSTKGQLLALQKDYGLLESAYTQATKDFLADKTKAKLAPGLGSYSVMLNKNYHLPSTYVPEGLRESTALRTKTVYLPEEVAVQAEAMIAAAQAEGLNIYLLSGYRSYAYQEKIFSKRVSSHGFAEAEKIIAIPGQSEHQSGLAIDVTAESINYALEDSFDETDEFDWLMDHCHEYGFILRYLKGRTETTGYVYEPWHYRYVQDPLVAKAIMDDGLTLEEYLGY